MEESLTFEDTIGNIDEILEKTESSICKELEISLVVSIDILSNSQQKPLCFKGRSYNLSGVAKGE